MGQRVIRFYDPDKHIIEVAENGADSLAKKGQEVVSPPKSVEVPSTKPVEQPHTPEKAIDTPVPEKSVEQPEPKEDVKPESGSLNDLEKLKIAKLKKDYSACLNKYGIDTKIDDGKYNNGVFRASCSGDKNFGFNSYDDAVNAKKSCRTVYLQIL